MHNSPGSSATLAALPGQSPCDKVIHMRVKVVLEPSDEGGYTVFVPSLPGCISEGDTAEEAVAHIREAIELYLEPVEDDLLPREGIEIVELVV